MHIAPCAVSAKTLIDERPLKVGASQKNITLGCLIVGAISLILYATTADPKLFWGSWYTNVFFWTGLAAGSCVMPAIFSVVGAKWAPPIRRIAEANVAFLPVGFAALLVTYFAKEHLFPWANAPMPGREWWMQPAFVYGRFAVLLGLLFLLMRRFVRMSLRADIGLLREKSANKDVWSKSEYDSLVSNWAGADIELAKIKSRLEFNAPMLILLYAVIYSLFAFEMLMSLDTVFYSNLFGAFIFVGNLFMGWAMLCLNTTRVAKENPTYNKVLGTQQLWDIGKLNFGFTMLWGYMFFAQFLPYWYANIPETSQWLILRTREYPWKSLAYVVFSCCFIFPFVLLLSRDLKKNAQSYRVVACIVLLGMWFEKYILITPQLSPNAIPLGLLDIGLTAGFYGLYRWRVHGFLAKYPYVPVGNMLLDEKEADHH